MNNLIWAKVGNACFPRYDAAGKVVGIGSYSTSPVNMDETDSYMKEVIYRVSPFGTSQQIWFFYDFVTDSAV